VDLPTLRGLFTLVLMIAFVGIVIWAWSGKRRKDFEEAARLPLDDDSPSADGEQPGKTRNGAGEQES
jgi:cytochrome c oxidase cbb3-type subunit 4